MRGTKRRYPSPPLPVVMPSTQQKVVIAAPPVPDVDAILTPEALALVAALHEEFDGRRRAVLARRSERRRALAAHPLGAPLDFPAETAGIRMADWQVAPAPPDLDDRRV